MAVITLDVNQQVLSYLENNQYSPLLVQGDSLDILRDFPYQFLDYMRREFRFEHIQNACLGDAVQIHTYSLAQTQDNSFRMELKERLSTDVNGIADALGLNVSPKLELEQIVAMLESKISTATLLQL
jgi:hypothetical protein